MKKIIFNNLFFLNWNYFNLLYTFLISVINYKLLMFSHFSYISIIKTFFNKICFYYSRSKNDNWIKGLYSNNFQILKLFFSDCDMDLLFLIILQNYNLTCHTKNNLCNTNLSFMI